MKRDLLTHGGALDQMKALYPEAPQPWLDLSTGINPWPYPVDGLDQDIVAHLPTSLSFDACRDAMSSYLGVRPETILLSPGSEILIKLLPLVLKLQRVAVLRPTYGDHACAWRRAGCMVVETEDPCSAPEDMDAVILCNPNNPDGRRFSRDMLGAVRQKLASKGGWLIIDEAYADLYPDLSLASKGGAQGLIVLRSFGKFFGLAGVRLGAMIAPTGVNSRMAALLGHWGVSGPALALGAIAYRDETWHVNARERIKETRRRLDGILEQAGLEVRGGTDLFRFVFHPDARNIWHRLAEQGVYTRRFDWSDTHLRIGITDNESDLRRRLATLYPSTLQDER